MTPITELPAVAAYLARIGATATSIRGAVIREADGNYYRDIARIRFAPDGEIIAPEELAPTDGEKGAILEEISEAKIPEHIYPASRKGLKAKGELFEFRDPSGNLIMLQERIEKPDGSKDYLPWTFWSDNVWRRLEPEGKLPLFNLADAREHSTVFVHEGPKSVSRLLKLLEAGSHPWQAELASAGHVGWIGGALNPYKTDWASLRAAGVSRVYIVADNDRAGLAAIPRISRELGLQAMSVQFNDDFPSGFDLGDRFPSAMWERGRKKAMHYTGPEFRTMVHPATWMTEPIPREPGQKGAIAYRLREQAKGMWVYCETADQFVLVARPDVIRDEKVFNRMCAPFSHVDNTAKYVYKAQTGRHVSIAYRPDKTERFIQNDGSSAINTWLGTTVRPIEGDATPWLKFLEHLFVDDEEREIAKRWIATLIARPGVRIGWALLAITNTQGIGKTTLGNHVLAPLVGPGNVSYPREADILSEFNEWTAHKRLAIVNEIYLGHGWKAYQVLQSAITDNRITVNRKHVRQYDIDNWCHIYACSNSVRALRIKNEDRRWFIPQLREKKKSAKYWANFYGWLRGPGLGIILQWALEHGDYLSPGEHGPPSKLKSEMIEDSLSEAVIEARALGGRLSEWGSPVVVSGRDVRAWVSKRGGGKPIYESDSELRRALVEGGGKVLSARTRIDGLKQWVACNQAFLDILPGLLNEGISAAEARKRHRISADEAFAEVL